MSGGQDAEMTDLKNPGPPGEEYEEIREQVRCLRSTMCVLNFVPQQSSYLIYHFFGVTGSLFTHRKHCKNNEEYPPRERQDCQGLEGNGSGMRLGIYFLHYVRSE
jgi:hypothetical protein